MKSDHRTPHTFIVTVQILTTLAISYFAIGCKSPKAASEPKYLETPNTSSFSLSPLKSTKREEGIFFAQREIPPDAHHVKGNVTWQLSLPLPSPPKKEDQPEYKMLQHGELSLDHVETKFEGGFLIVDGWKSSDEQAYLHLLHLRLPLAEDFNATWLSKIKSNRPNETSTTWYGGLVRLPGLHSEKTKEWTLLTTGDVIASYKDHATPFQCHITNRRDFRCYNLRVWFSRNGEISSADNIYGGFRVTLG